MDAAPTKGGASGRLAAGGALAAAIGYALATVCCAPIALGVAAGAVAALSWLRPLQPYLAGFAVLLLAWAFVLAHRRSVRCEPEESSLPDGMRGSVEGEGGGVRCRPASRPPLMLWLLAAIVALLLTAPFWTTLL